MKKICIIGLGNMGKAIFDFLKADKKFRVTGCDRGDNSNKFLKECDVFVIAIKPQDFEKLARSVKADLSGKLAISIMAGVSMNRIARKMKVKKVVRVMPNLALQIKKSVSGWIANENVSAAEKKIVKNILKKFGKEVEVDREGKINMITALSGSGPAYFFKLAETLAKIAVRYGFSQKDAEMISENTLIGAAGLLGRSKESAASLREKVTSKGGTTEAAIKSMDSNNLDKIVIEAVEAARRRADELNS
jgi:pyrroline-5-carboxylate reductase